MGGLFPLATSLSFPGKIFMKMNARARTFRPFRPFPLYLSMAFNLVNGQVGIYTIYIIHIFVYTEGGGGRWGGKTAALSRNNAF